MTNLKRSRYMRALASLFLAIFWLFQEVVKIRLT